MPTLQPGARQAELVPGGQLPVRGQVGQRALAVDHVVHSLAPRRGRVPLHAPRLHSPDLRPLGNCHTHQSSMTW